MHRVASGLLAIFRLVCCALAFAPGLSSPAGAASDGDGAVVPRDSIYVVEVRSAGGVMRRGSAVAIGRDMLLTNCHVTRGAAHIQVGREGYTWPASVRTGNGELDLCVLTSPLGAVRT